MVVIVKLNSAFSHLDKKNGSKTIPFKQAKAFTLSKMQAWMRRKSMHREGDKLTAKKL